MPAPKQLLFPTFTKLQKRDFGGSLIKGNPREARPLSVKRPMHLVLRSTLARGELSFLRGKRARKIRELVTRTGSNHDVRVYRYANSANHLHLIILPKSRKAFNAFIRSISGLIARLTLGVERGRALVSSSGMRALSLEFWIGEKTTNRPVST